ncbi:MAG: hypothetical protein ISR90_03935 [Candidatus Marinimicrobia bacterium]|nr:hypothetical protein [Candidatus Neomarinimicrobiota bacterium]MBL7023190.1 hypothetical protein [Candidatus Neomarinimicrobiota bacterium]
MFTALIEMKYHKLFFLFMLFGMNLSASSFIVGFKVPVYLTASIRFGYDSNVLKLSSEEQSRDEVNFILGSADTFDSGFTRKNLMIKYSPRIIENHKTKIVMNIAQTEYYQHSDKSFVSFSVSAEQHFDSYHWLKFRYSNLPTYYIRPYRDSDTFSDGLQSCDFSNENIRLIYSVPVYNKTSIKIRLGRTKLYYNPYFTEFDTDVTSFRTTLSIYKIKPFKFIAWAELGTGNNISYLSETTSSKFDRSYKYNQFGGEIEWSPKSIIKSVGFSIDIHQRYYLSEGEDDPLHSGRKHEDVKSMAWIKKDVTNKLGFSLSVVNRQKTTFSDYSWVQDLKSYNKFEIWLGCSYKMYFNFLY